jgi:hypothetical protein
MNTAKLQYCDPVSVLKPRILIFNTVGNPKTENSPRLQKEVFEMVAEIVN